MKQPLVVFSPLLVLSLAASSAACAKKSGDAAADKSEGGAGLDAGYPEFTAAPADAEHSESGLAWKVLQPGTGTEHPAATDKVKVAYSGWTRDGKMFDSSSKHGGSAEFELNKVIPGWTEGVQLMVVGEKRRFWVPGKLAYGDKPRFNGPFGDLTFDIELQDIKHPPPPPPVPSDVAAAPADAKKTADGLQYKLLEPTKDPKAIKPDANSMVTVNYAGWTTDGKMFDYSSDHPAQFPLGRVIKGWTEGLQLMHVGDKMRFWIPGALAYDDPSRPSRPGVPHGTLVFDVTLLDSKSMPPMPGMPGSDGGAPRRDGGAPTKPMPSAPPKPSSP